MTRKLVPLGLAATLLIAAGAVRAHSASTSFLTLERGQSERDVALRWDFAVADLAFTVDIDQDLDDQVTWGEIEAARETIARLVESGVSVRAGGERCPIRMTDLALTERFDEPFVSVLLTANCASNAALAVTASLFFSSDSSQRILLHAQLADRVHDAVLSPQSTTWTMPPAPTVWATLGSFIVQGFWHVLIGADHIVFLLLLLLPAVVIARDGAWLGAPRMRQVAWDVTCLVTAFTIAHSLTLGLAATNTVVLPERPVEAAIALSIVVAGLANLVPALHRMRLAVAFGFGLVHGFGFANALREIDTAGFALVPLLAGFNVGVELAQLAIVAVVLPLLYAVRDTGWYTRRALPACSCALAAVGAWWMLTRLA